MEDYDNDYDDVDPLGEFIHTRRKESRNIILQAAELIAPILGRDEVSRTNHRGNVL